MQHSFVLSPQAMRIQQNETEQYSAQGAPLSPIDCQQLQANDRSKQVSLKLQFHKNRLIRIKTPIGSVVAEQGSGIGAFLGAKGLRCSGPRAGLSDRLYLSCLALTISNLRTSNLSQRETLMKSSNYSNRDFTASNLKHMRSTLYLNFNASSTVMQQETGVTLDDAVIAAGGFGRFQWILLAFYIMAFCSANFVLYNIDPLTQKPVYMCETQPGSKEYVVCSADTICESDFTIEYYINWDDEDSLHNWVEKMDLMCEPESKIARISSVYYIGEIIGCIMIARIPDIFGRKWPLAITNAIQFPVFIAVLLSTSLTFTTVLAFFMGVLHIGIYNGAYINICEYVHEKWKNHICTVLLCFDMLTVITIGFYWQYVSHNYLGLLIFACSLNGISMIALFFIPESPEYLYSFYRFGECRQVLEQIANWNKKDQTFKKFKTTQTP